MPAKKTSQVQDFLKMYTALREQQDNYLEQHSDVLDEMKRIEDQIRLAEEQLKSAVRETGENVKNDRFIVKASKSFRKWFDWSTVKEMAKKAELDVIEARAVKSVDLDPKMMQELVMEGKIRPEIVQNAFREQELTTRVTIGEAK